MKVDKGFELSYWNLSYRRKFIRTLWMIPFGFFALALLYFVRISSIIMIIYIVIFLIVEVSQLRYTYYHWKKEEL